MSFNLRTSAATEPRVASSPTRLVAVDVPAGVTSITPGLATVTAVRLVGNPAYYRLAPGPVQDLCHISEEDARRDLAEASTAGMPFNWTQASSGDVLLTPRFELPLILEIEGCEA